jgi:hypothetical protein
MASVINTWFNRSKAMTEYNGHKNWTHWNVSLWVGNDESLYRRAIDHLKRARRDRYGHARSAESATRVAARRLFADLGGRGAKTPDGASYSVTSLHHALIGLE